MSGLRLDDFDPKARKLLESLTKHDISMIAGQARSEREHVDEATFPTEPRAALKEVRDLLRRRPEAEVDDGLDELVQGIRLAILAVQSMEVLDDCESEALKWLLLRMETLAVAEERWNHEARARLRKLATAMGA